MSKKILITFFMAILISSCSSPEVTHSAPELEEGWYVRMIQTGGIAGVNRAVEVLSDGSYTIYQQAGGEGIKGNLSEPELAQLEEIIKNLEISIPAIKGGCADCFFYDIEIQSGGRKMVFQLDDISLPDSGAGELVTFLSGLMQ